MRHHTENSASYDENKKLLGENEKSSFEFFSEPVSTTYSAECSLAGLPVAMLSLPSLLEIFAFGIKKRNGTATLAATA